MASAKAAPAPRRSRDDSADPPASFVSAIEDFSSAVRRSRARAAREAGAGELTASQYQLLSALAEGADQPVGELADAACIAAPTATRMLDGLERAGIVERRHSTVDRRVVTVRLTPKGHRLVERKQQVVAEKRRALWASLGPSERQQVERLLRRLAEVIEEL